MPQQQKHKKKLVFAVTNDLNYDQRMIRICTSLQNGGYDVLLVGRKLKKSLPLSGQNFQQKRLFCFYNRGKLFYIEYNIRLLLFLLFQKMDLICAIDLDTILPCYLVSAIRQKKRVYDAHELFCEMKEIVTRPAIYKIWKSIEKFAVPKFKWGYTVNEPIQLILHGDYKVDYCVIMNVPFLKPLHEVKKERFIIYQGAVNEGRSFETLIPAFQWIDCPLWIFGSGNYFEECKRLIEENQLQEKVILKGSVLPSDLSSITPRALLGITLFEKKGLSNYYSLANRFFDYMQAGIPQICVNYPVYQKINNQFEVAVLVDDLSPGSLATAINSVLNDEVLQKRIQHNCLLAKEVFSWQNEEKKLLDFYHEIFTA